MRNQRNVYFHKPFREKATFNFHSFNEGPDFSKFHPKYGKNGIRDNKGGSCDN